MSVATILEITLSMSELQLRVSTNQSIHIPETKQVTTAEVCPCGMTT